MLAEARIGPSNSVLSSLKMWDHKKRLDAIVYVGLAHHCLLLIDQMVQLDSSVPVIVTDGCNADEFPGRARKLSSSGVYALSPAHSFSDIGRDTVALLQIMFERCNQDEGSCGQERGALLKFVQESKHRLRLTSGQEEQSAERREYCFDSSGNNMGMDFAVRAVTATGELAPHTWVRQQSSCPEFSSQ